mmetsp:Transcript_57236/g.179278  ORF Transcript_57236/g.179278 Transcript_57236/m.179278 type:complete len:287 (-) Transcript_57236:512-1372(-)
MPAVLPRLLGLLLLPVAGGRLGRWHFRDVSKAVPVRGPDPHVGAPICIPAFPELEARPALGKGCAHHFVHHAEQCLVDGATGPLGVERPCTLRGHVLEDALHAAEGQDLVELREAVAAHAQALVRGAVPEQRGKVLGEPEDRSRQVLLVLASALCVFFDRPARSASALCVLSDRLVCGCLLPPVPRKKQAPRRRGVGVPGVVAARLLPPTNISISRLCLLPLLIHRRLCRSHRLGGPLRGRHARRCLARFTQADVYDAPRWWHRCRRWSRRWSLHPATATPVSWIW